MIQIALCTDNNYAMPAGVMMYSVCVHTPGVSFNVIVPEDFSEENRAKLRRVTEPFDAAVDFIVIPENLADGFPVGREDQPEHISIAAYYRLFLGRLLSPEIDKVIYLDCDLICLSSLEELWAVDLKGAPLACVPEIQRPWQHPQLRLGYDESIPYFNSGVLLINLDYWRRNGVESRFMDFLATSREKIQFHDQDILNWAFHDSALFLPPRFNAMDFLFHKGLADCDFPFPVEDAEQARTNPVIVHFTYKHKPWIKGGSHTYRKAFLDFKSKTPWKGQRLIMRKSDTFKGKVADLLVFFGLYRYHDDYIVIPENTEH